MIAAMIAITYLAAAIGLLVLLISETSRTDAPVAWPELLMLALAWPVVLCALLRDHDETEEKL